MPLSATEGFPKKPPELIKSHENNPVTKQLPDGRLSKVILQSNGKSLNIIKTNPVTKQLSPTEGFPK